MFPENNYGTIHLIGDDSKVDTPLPIPNTEVKHFNGENSVSEDSKLPIFFCIQSSKKFEFFKYQYVLKCKLHDLYLKVYISLLKLSFCF